MTDTHKRDWKEIAEDASHETDNAKLMEKVRELVDAFDSTHEPEHKSPDD